MLRQLLIIPLIAPVVLSSACHTPEPAYARLPAVLEWRAGKRDVAIDGILGILKPGMRIREVRKLLGSPDHTRQGARLEWHYRWQGVRLHHSKTPTGARYSTTVKSRRLVLRFEDKILVRAALAE